MSATPQFTSLPIFCWRLPSCSEGWGRELAQQGPGRVRRSPGLGGAPAGALVSGGRCKRVHVADLSPPSLSTDMG